VLCFAAFIAAVEKSSAPIADPQVLPFGKAASSRTILRQSRVVVRKSGPCLSRLRFDFSERHATSQHSALKCLRRSGTVPADETRKVADSAIRDILPCASLCYVAPPDLPIVAL
jgi:hypothetical protein